MSYDYEYNEAFLESRRRTVSSGNDIILAAEFCEQQKYGRNRDIRLDVVLTDEAIMGDYRTELNAAWLVENQNGLIRVIEDRRQRYRRPGNRVLNRSDYPASIDFTPADSSDQDRPGCCLFFFLLALSLAVVVAWLIGS